MSLRSGTQKYGLPKDEWFTEGGYTRNLYLEEFLPSEVKRVYNLLKGDGSYNRGWKGSINPMDTPNPSWWTDYTTFQDDNYTLEEAIEYLKQASLWQSVNQAWDGYRGSYYPRDPSYAQRASGGSNINASIKKLEAQLPPGQQIGFDVIPQVFAEEDPSVNSGLNGNEQESQVINYPQSANVRIIISNISMFSTSIPINDISQLQILSNESNEWRYTLIGTSTNQPLMTLSGLVTKINNMIASAVTPQPPVTQPPVIEPPVTQPPVIEPPVVTTVHVPPPDIVLDPSDGLPEVPVTVTPTEPGQVNWIPEPFFSFINNVFRR